MSGNVDNRSGSDEDGNDTRTKGRNVLRMFSLREWGWRQFEEHGRLCLCARRVPRGSVETVEEYVNFIYDSRSRQILTWGEES